MKRFISLLIGLIALTFIVGCDIPERTKSADEIQKKQQETMLKEATAQTGMPAIKNFRERKILKDILELRDQEGLVTYTYLFNELNGKLIFLGQTIGYGIPYATQYTNPQKFDFGWLDNGYSMRENRYISGVIPQADPNGLYSPASAEGTWVLMKDPNSSKVVPIYVEPRIIVSPFKLNVD